MSFYSVFKFEPWRNLYREISNLVMEFAVDYLSQDMLITGEMKKNKNSVVYM